MNTDETSEEAQPAPVAISLDPADEALVTAVAIEDGPTHCPYRRTVDLLQRLAPGRMRIAFLIGAGCPLSIRIADGESTRPLIPDIAGVTKVVAEQLAADEALGPVADEIWKRVRSRGIDDPTIEDVLSHVRSLHGLCGKAGIDGFQAAQLTSLDQAICHSVRDLMNKGLPSRSTPYHALAGWIQAIAREYPVEVFTTNYDLLMEQAFEEQGVPYFDGFVGSHSAFLDLDSMAEDDLPARWARLWKIHGSINWWLTPENKIRRSRDSIEGEQLLIYPSHLKYNQSRKMPYFAMIDRLRVFLRSNQCVLVTCGYSFADEHINDFIAQGLESNPNAACLSMIWGDRSSSLPAMELGATHANFTVLAADGGSVGTIARRWSDETNENNPAYSITVARCDLPHRSKAPADQCKWLLGDFASFGQFLSNQLSSRDIEQDAKGGG